MKSSPNDDRAAGSDATAFYSWRMAWSVVLAAANDRVFPVSEQRQTAAAYGADFMLLTDIAHDTG